MICSKFLELSPMEKIIFIGELTHACMNDNDVYDMGVFLIKKATEKGLFDNVIIMPENKSESDDD